MFECRDPSNKTVYPKALTMYVTFGDDPFSEVSSEQHIMEYIVHWLNVYATFGQIYICIYIYVYFQACMYNIELIV